MKHETFGGVELSLGFLMCTNYKNGDKLITEVFKIYHSYLKFHVNLVAYADSFMAWGLSSTGLDQPEENSILTRFLVCTRVYYFVAKLF